MGRRKKPKNPESEKNFTTDSRQTDSPGNQQQDPPPGDSQQTAQAAPDSPDTQQQNPPSGDNPQTTKAEPVNQEGRQAAQAAPPPPPNPTGMDIRRGTSLTSRALYAAEDFVPGDEEAVGKQAVKKVALHETATIIDTADRISGLRSSIEKPAKIPSAVN